MKSDGETRKHCRTVAGRTDTGAVVLLLLYSSRWFEVTPLPDDLYEITVKEENKGLLDRLITSNCSAAST